MVNNNIAVPSVRVVLDKPRKLIFDFNALAIIEEKTGRSFMQAKKDWVPALKDVRVIVWAGLLREDPAVELGMVGRFIHIGNLPTISGAMTKALSLSMGDADPNPPAPAATMTLEAKPEPTQVM